MILKRWTKDAENGLKESIPETPDNSIFNVSFYECEKGLDW